jgi:hypothetical protein
MTWSGIHRNICDSLLQKPVNLTRPALPNLLFRWPSITKAMYIQVYLGMRFRMMFETEKSGVRRYMGTVTGISDLDPVRWKNSQWRNLQVLLKGLI